MIIVGVLFLGPLLLIVSMLKEARAAGPETEGELAMQYVDAFDRRWVQGERDAREPLVGTADVRSLGDVQSNDELVAEMRRIPVTPRLVTRLRSALILPMLPLLLF
jgi:hypothetical protein